MTGFRNPLPPPPARLRETYTVTCDGRRYDLRQGSDGLYAELGVWCASCRSIAFALIRASYYSADPKRFAADAKRAERAIG